MRCGINPGQSSVSSCSSMCRKSPFPLFGKLYTASRGGVSQVCFHFNHRVPNANFSDTPTLTCISSVAIAQTLNSSYCNYSNTAPLVAYRAIPRFVLGVALLILAFIPTLKQSVEIYKVTRRWKTTQSMQLLVREGAVYFVVYVFSCYVISIRLSHSN